MRVDVLVEMQHILGVVLFLDLDKSSVVRGVSCPDKFIARFAQLVDVHAMRKGLQFVTQSLDPLHRRRLLGRSAPGSHNVHLMTRPPKGKRGVAHSHARDGAVKGHNELPVVWWRIVGCRCYGGNSARGEFRKKQVRLEMRDGCWKECCPLSFQVGHHPDTVLLRFERSQRP